MLLLQQKAEARKLVAAAAAAAAYRAKQKEQQAGKEASANTLSSTSSSGAQTLKLQHQRRHKLKQHSTRCAQPSSGYKFSNYFVQLIVHLHYLIQLVNVHWGAKTLAPWAGDWGNGGQWAAAQRQDSVLLLHVGMMVDMDT